MSDTRLLIGPTRFWLEGNLFEWKGNQTQLSVSSGSYTFLRGLNLISCLEMGYISNQTVIYDFTSAQWPAVAAVRWEELEVVTRGLS